ncbi:hypothetical protein DEU56DRAFT_874448 [Suillus clintonianus]|uniref:uncharacterized protein n=1 Tax=Suillus clintonianus TaxID=1904413 RepID=UPI001B867029|nr:uncharacterized protein DEU56DRAFT_874448 [Suillus clintonianus]KAG2111131.1 hypothetical protein DEU56DRAFT_874448 [Suillus clintonianus]
MTTNCPNCLKEFQSAWAVSRHLSQPLTSCLRWVDQLEDAAQILQDSQFADQHATLGPSESSSNPRHSRTPSPFQVQVDSEEMVHVQDLNDSGYFYGDEGGVVGLESDLPGSVEEPLGSPSFGEALTSSASGTLRKCIGAARPFWDRTNLYYPFAIPSGLGARQLLLLCSSLSMAAIDEFLELELIKALSLSFCTAKELRGRAELLPPVPKWQYRIVSTTHPTKQPLYLYWRDPLDCIESLFSHPLFAKEIDVTPQRVYHTVERTSRIYNEWLTGDAAWSMQSQLPDGATLLGIILSSDKTKHHQHDCLANIKMATRNKASSHAFLLTALLPIAEFLHPVKRNAEFHQCLDIVLEPLKQAARIGPDDLPKMTLDQLSSISCDPLDVEGYFNACAPFRLSGVAQPFWRDWSLADPHVFFTPEPLHHWHREFYDHDVKWCLAAVGEQELDFRFSVSQPLTTFRHFKDGISKLKQVTGRAQRDMQRYIVALIADAAPRSVVIAVRALMDFRYISQATTIDEAHCQRFSQEIIACGARRGAKSKQVLDNWHIPKLELMQSVEPSIRQVGSLLQWSADTTEHAHITLIKDPADSSNNINYDAQICRFLDRREKCRNFQIATSIIARSQSQSQASTSRMTDASSEHHDESHDEDPHADKSNLQTGLDDLWGPKRVVTDFFKKAEQLSSDIEVARPLHTFVVGAAAIHLNFDPSIRRIPVDVVAEKFSLPDLRGALADYIQREGMAQNVHSLRGQRRALPDAPLPFNDLMVWFKVRVQQASYHSPSITPPALTVNAHPPSATWKYGRYDAAIFTVDDTGREQWPTSGLKGHDVVEVHLIMQPLPPRGKPGSAPWATRFLTYVQRLDVMPQRHGSLLECTTQMHVLKRAMRSAGTPFGDILPLDQLRSFAQIIPRFGRVADSRLTAQNSAHFAQTFFLNKYINKDFYYAISN